MDVGPPQQPVSVSRAQYETNAQIVGEETKAGAGLEAANDPANLSTAEIQTLLQKTAEINLSLQTLQATMKSLEDMYGQELRRGR